MHRTSLRAVFDPGVLVSAALSPAGTPAELVGIWKSGGFELVVSEALLAEDEAREYIGRFRRLATLAPDPEVTPGVTPDPKDDYLVALARSSEARFLVSGDPHLTGLDDPRPRVLAPRAFLEALET